MVTLTRKAREIRERELLFLEVAQRLLLERGYHGLTMDRIAEATEYSKGTVYLHFKCKEEVIIALAKRGLERRLALFERASRFPGNPRERMTAIGEASDLFTRLYAGQVRVFQIMNAEAVTQKVSEKYLTELKAIVRRTLSIILEIMHDAVGLGDLTFRDGRSPEELTFALWAITEGGYGVATGWIPLEEVGIYNPMPMVINACILLCDGYGWRPLSTESDYIALRDRLRREVFPEEALLVYGPAGLP